MVQHAGGSAALKLLLLQNALKVLHALVQIPHVSWQVAVEETDGVTKHGHPGADAAFITLGIQRGGGRNSENVINTTDARQAKHARSLVSRLDSNMPFYAKSFCLSVD